MRRGNGCPRRISLVHIHNGGIAFSSGQLTWNVAAEVQQNLHFASWEEDFARLAESEWRAYSCHVTDFELERYLHTS